MNQYSRDESRLRNANGNFAWQRWGAIVGGSALAAFGLSRRSKTGAAIAAAGGLLAFGGTRISSTPKELHAEASFTINVSPEEAYRFWHDFENLPRFMSHLESVRVLDGRRSEWTARGPLQMRIKWNAEIVDERENQWIVWRSNQIPSSLMKARCSFGVRPAIGERKSLSPFTTACLLGRLAKPSLPSLARILNMSFAKTFATSSNCSRPERSRPPLASPTADAVHSSR